MSITEALQHQKFGQTLRTSRTILEQAFDQIQAAIDLRLLCVIYIYEYFIIDSCEHQI